MSAKITITFQDRSIEGLTRKAWDIYRREVGGVAHDGSPLPEWDAFRDTKQGKAWRAVVEGLIETNVTI